MMGGLSANLHWLVLLILNTDMTTKLTNIDEGTKKHLQNKNRVRSTVCATTISKPNQDV